MGLGRSLEDYLEAILIVQIEKGEVRSVDVARQLNFSKPSVTHATKELRKKGYLIMDGDGCLKFTDKGSELANQVYERHQFFLKVFTELGVSPEVAEEDACKIEHAISQESFEKLKTVLKKSE